MIGSIPPNIIGRPNIEIIEYLISEAYKLSLDCLEQIRSGDFDHCNEVLDSRQAILDGLRYYVNQVIDSPLYETYRASLLESLTNLTQKILDADNEIATIIREKQDSIMQSLSTIMLGKTAKSAYIIDKVPVSRFIDKKQ